MKCEPFEISEEEMIFQETVKAMEAFNKCVANEIDNFNLLIFKNLPVRKKKKIGKWLKKEREKYHGSKDFNCFNL